MVAGSSDMRPLDSFWLSVGFALMNAVQQQEQKEVSQEILVELKGECLHLTAPMHRSKLTSQDGFFYYAQGSSELATIVEMCLQSVLSPGVVLVRSPDAAVLGQIHDQVGSGLACVDVSLLEEGIDTFVNTLIVIPHSFHLNSYFMT